MKFELLAKTLSLQSGGKRSIRDPTASVAMSCTVSVRWRSNPAEPTSAHWEDHSYKDAGLTVSVASITPDFRGGGEGQTMGSNITILLRPRLTPGMCTGNQI